MTAIVQRVRDIVRSNSEPKVVDNYASTSERLAAAIELLQTSLNDSAGIKSVIEGELVNYRGLVKQYSLREREIQKVMDTPAGSSSKPLGSLYDTAQKMRRIAEQAVTVYSERLNTIDGKRAEVLSTVKQLQDARRQLDMAQTVVGSRARLNALSSRGHHGDTVFSGMEQTSELRAATHLAKEAEALAELKGWGI